MFLFVSNQIAVFHSVAPIFAVALSRPQPSSDDFKSVRISVAVVSGSDTKHQPPVPECCQSVAVNSYFIWPVIFFFFGLNVMDYEVGCLCVWPKVSRLDTALVSLK